jgi:hypothetical protein
VSFLEIIVTAVFWFVISTTVIFAAERRRH